MEDLKGQKQESEWKMFRCECGYEGLRANNNKICKCGKEGKLFRMVEDGQTKTN